MMSLLLMLALPVEFAGPPVKEIAGTPYTGGKCLFSVSPPPVVLSSRLFLKFNFSKNLVI
jgi:hypothetical protein